MCFYLVWILLYAVFARSLRMLVFRLVLFSGWSVGPREGYHCSVWTPCPCRRRLARIYPLVNVYSFLLNMAQWKYWIFRDFPLTMGIFHSYVSLPEGILLVDLAIRLGVFPYSYGNVYQRAA